jgi:hypothetical protein
MSAKPEYSQTTCDAISTGDSVDVLCASGRWIRCWVSRIEIPDEISFLQYDVPKQAAAPWDFDLTKICELISI